MVTTDKKIQTPEPLYALRKQAVQDWVDEEYPSIEQRAKAEGVEHQWRQERSLIVTMTNQSEAR